MDKEKNKDTNEEELLIVNDVDAKEKAENEASLETIKKATQMSNTMTADWRELSKNGNMKSSKKGLKVLIAIIIILLILGAGVFSYFKFLKPDSEAVFSKIIKSGTSELTKTVNNSLKNIDHYTRTGNLSINTDITDYKIFNGISLDYTMGLDLNSKLMSIDFNYKEQDKDILTGILYFKDKKVYLKSDQLFKKLLYLSEMDEDLFKEMPSKEDIENIKYISKQGSVYLQKALTKATYKTEYGSVLVKGKEVKVQKNIMIIDKYNASNIKNELLNSIKNDSRFIEVLKKLYNVDDVSKEIEDSIKEEVPSDFETITIEIDTSGIFVSKLVGLKMIKEKETILNMVAKSNKSYDFTVGKEFKGTLTVNSLNNISVETKVQGYTIELGVISSSSSDDYKLDVKVKDTNNKYINVSMKNNSTNKSITDVSVDGAVDVSNMNKSDQETYQKNLMKVFNSSSVISYLMQSQS